MKPTIAIIGSGVCGAICAHELSKRGHRVSVFDKGRGPGGRVSTRRTDTGHRFEHGGARIDVTSTHQHDTLRPLLDAGVLTRQGDAYTSPTGMNALCKWMLEGLPVRYSTRLVRVDHAASWELIDDTSAPHGPFDAVVLTVPPANACELIAGFDEAMASTIANVRMLPQWVAMLAFADRLADVADHTDVAGHLLRRSLCNTVGDALVVHASHAWSTDHLERDATEIAHLLYTQVKPALGASTPIALHAHRWRYAAAEQPLGEPFLRHPAGLFVGGDWCVGSTIASAFDSAFAIIDAIAASHP
jgi:renalase